MARRLRVGADRKPEWLVLDALRPEEPRHATRRARGDDRQVGGPLAAAGFDADDTVTLHQRRRRRFPLDLRTGLLSGGHQMGIEVAARPHGTVGREAAVVGPGEFTPCRARDHPQAVDSM